MASQFKNRVGLNIRNYRLDSGQTLRQVADKVGITEATMQKYEAGNISRVDVEMLKNIADAIGCSPNDLTGWKIANESSSIEIEIEKLSAENRQHLVEYAKFLLSQQKI